MAKISFTKGHGTGNDFVLIFDENAELSLSTDQIAKLCDRHFGIGADGLIRVVRSKNLEAGKKLSAEHPEAQWFMDYYNSDGSTAEMCGNGARVFARFLLEYRLASLKPGETLSIGTRAGVKDIQLSTNGFAIDMGRWKLGSDSLEVSANRLDVSRPGLSINVGNPHVVVALASQEELDQLDLGEAPRVTPLQSEGANIEFVVPGDPLLKDGVGQISMRVHERGVGETLSCGTGIVASALAVRNWAGEGAPNFWQVKVPGGVLGVRMFATEDGEHVGLSGPAELVYSGEIEIT